MLRNSLIRESDGYLNATEMCKIGKKLFGNYYKNSSTKKLIKELSINLKLTENQLIEIKKGGNDKTSQGSWVHPKIGIHLAQWISVKFMVEISEWIEEWKKYNNNNQIKYEKAINNIEPDDILEGKENEIQLKLQEKLGGKIEVYTEFGYIDLLTDNDLIEIKLGKNWKHGVGQLLAYNEFFLIII